VDDWVRSAPVFKDNRYFFATLKGSLYGLAFAGDSVKQIFKKHLSHHPILADLAMKDNKIVINDSDLWSYCVDTTGSNVWKMSLIESFMKDGNRIFSDQIAGGAYYQSKPTAVNDTVYFGTPMRFIYAVDAHTGKEKWKFELGASISGAPTVGDGKIFVGQQGGEDEYYCLEAETGKKIWDTKLDWVWGSATYSDGMVYVPGIDGYAWALDAENGHVVWKQPFSMSVCSEPAVEGDIVIFGCWDNYLKAFDKKTGKLLWQYNGAGTDSGVAIIKNGRVYVKNKCIDAQTGKLIWEFKDGNNIFNITPAYHDGKVYMSCWHGLGLGGICVRAMVYCIDAETGELIWKQQGPDSAVRLSAGKGMFISRASPIPISIPWIQKETGTVQPKSTGSTRWATKSKNLPPLCTKEKPTSCHLMAISTPFNNGADGSLLV
jgi:outer membrane protein assembly factor BamB